MKHFATITMLVMLGSMLNLRLFAQKSDTTTFIKLYSNFYLFSKFRSPVADYHTDYGSLEFGGISPAIQWAGKRERKYHELELSVIRFKRTENEIQILNEREISFRYEFGKKRPSRNNGKTYWQRGWSFRPFYYYADSEPLLRSGSPQSNGDYGFSFSYVPRYNVKLSSKLQLDVNLMLGFTAAAEHQIIDNPALLKNQRDQLIFSFDLLEELPVRIGIVYRL